MPVKGGVVVPSSIRTSSQGTEMTINATNDLTVQAVQNSKVERIFAMDSTYSVVTQGYYRAVYANLDTLFVNVGDVLKRGQLIGIVKRDTISGNALVFI